MKECPGCWPANPKQGYCPLVFPRLGGGSGGPHLPCPTLSLRFHLNSIQMCFQSHHGQNVLSTYYVLTSGLCSQDSLLPFPTKKTSQEQRRTTKQRGRRKNGGERRPFRGDGEFYWWPVSMQRFQVTCPRCVERCRESQGSWSETRLSKRQPRGTECGCVGSGFGGGNSASLCSPGFQLPLYLHVGSFLEPSSLTW